MLLHTYARAQRERTLTKPTVTYCCEAHQEGRLNPTDPLHVLAQLRAEGHKRVEAFLFEHLFLHLVATGLGAHNVTSHWLFQTDDAGTPRYWFRLLTPSTRWADLDDEIAEFLLSRDGHVIQVMYEPSPARFVAQAVSQNTSFMPLPAVLAALLHRRAPIAAPRDYKHIDGQLQAHALQAIEQRFTKADLFNVSVARTLINCYLYPWFGKQPMDIDAAVRHEKGFRFVEFKRKYPARDGRYGLDGHPHGMLADWLEAHDHPLLHVILNDPLWDKTDSPVHLLTASSPTAPFADWIGVELIATCFAQAGAFHTSGADSGMLGGYRHQRKINTEATCLLGSGLAPENLCTFLRHPHEVPAQNLQQHLIRQRGRARRAHVQA